MLKKVSRKKTVYVAMSGGVDSSVAAALLKKAYLDSDGRIWIAEGRSPKARYSCAVVGVFMKPYQPRAGIFNFQFSIFNKDNCLWKQDREDALRVAAKLDIPLLTWDLSKEYEKRVVRYMIDGYKKGITPNPDVMCNKFIKFGLFLEKALEMGADYIATGHYVRKQTTYNKQQTTGGEKTKKSSVVSYKLLVGIDENKDQSYFLYTLTQEQLSRCLFPVGDWNKKEVRKMAKKFGLPNWDKKDSQGVCFVGPLEVKEFLKRNIKSKRGLVLRKSDRKILGEHDGVWYYTIGQRHGFGLNGGRPYYVVDKDTKKNILYVDDLKNPKSQAPNPKQILNPKIQIRELNWIRKQRVPLNCKVKTRYRQKDIDCTIIKNGSDKALVEIKENNLAIAPGQSAVFYKGNEVLGGGIIV
ncbi:MAG: hypothetical protein G01um10142_124 [Parcubacteria group bacterium Gr01-1014_2]|nr:MAG: hypothetical protein G01um10142_124 [Parcubacteria group bacterium Gr01-1014_2]